MNVTPTQLQQNLWIFRLQIVLKFTTYFIYNHVFKMGVNYSWLLLSILIPPCKSFDLLSMTPQVVLPAMSCKHLEMQAYACHGTKPFQNKNWKIKLLRRTCCRQYLINVKTPKNWQYHCVVWIFWCQVKTSNIFIQISHKTSTKKN